jgi:tyrosyl-tRNA synthetase
LVTQGGVSVNNGRIDDPAHQIGPNDLASDTTLVLRVGKKRYFLVRFE